MRYRLPASEKRQLLQMKTIKEVGIVRRIFTGCVTLIFGLCYGIAGPNAVDHHQSGGAVLTQSASSGQRTIVVNDSARIGNPTIAITIQSPDGSTQETHYNEVTLNASLSNPFPANSKVSLSPGSAGSGPKHGVAAGAPGWMVFTDGGGDFDGTAIVILATLAAIAAVALAVAGD